MLLAPSSSLQFRRNYGLLRARANRNNLVEILPWIKVPCRGQHRPAALSDVTAIEIDALDGVAGSTRRRWAETPCAAATFEMLVMQPRP